MGEIVANKPARLLNPDSAKTAIDNLELCTLNPEPWIFP
jgi:hypothetical protein